MVNQIYDGETCTCKILEVSLGNTGSVGLWSLLVLAPSEQKVESSSLKMTVERDLLPLPLDFFRFKLKTFSIACHIKSTHFQIANIQTRTGEKSQIKCMAESPAEGVEWSPSGYILAHTISKQDCDCEPEPAAQVSSDAAADLCCSVWLQWLRIAIAEY